MIKNLEAQTTPEAEKPFLTTTYIDMTRHGSRFGGKMTVTFPDGETLTFEDPTDLTPQGKKTVQAISALAYPEEVVLVHPRGGDEPRHGETGEDIMIGSQKIGPTRSAASLGAAPTLKQGKVKGSRLGKGLDYASAGMAQHSKELWK